MIRETKTREIWGGDGFSFGEIHFELSVVHLRGGVQSPVRYVCLRLGDKSELETIEVSQQ